jgi:hypothetical protein
MVNLLDGPPDMVMVSEASQRQESVALGHDFHRGRGLSARKGR